MAQNVTLTAKVADTAPGIVLGLLLGLATLRLAPADQVAVGVMLTWIGGALRLRQSLREIKRLRALCAANGVDPDCMGDV